MPILGRGALGVLALVLAGLSAAHAATGCGSAPAPQVTLTRLSAPPVIDTALDLAALQAVARTDAAHASSLLLGLTSWEATGRYQVAYASLPRAPGGPVCAVVEAVRVSFGFDRMIVRIAREVVGDRCLYEAVQGHEMRHVRVAQDMLTQYAPWIEARLRAAVAAIGAVPGASLEAASSTIDPRLDAAFSAAFQSFQRELTRRQAVVDAPEEYRRMGAVCDGAGPRLIERLRRSAG